MAQVAHAHAGVMSMPRLGPAGVGMGVTKPKAQERRVVSGPGSVGSSGAVLTGAGVSGKGRGSGIPGGLDLTTVFEGSGESAEDAGGCEVALELGRAEEGRIVW